MRSFSHDRLDLDRRQIRLVEVLPGSASPVKCRITTYLQAACPPYIAVSYVWGDDNGQQVIVLNGRSFSVKLNLHHFLEVVSSSLLKVSGRRNGGAEFSLPARHLWIDQLSIDQSRLDERNEQVRRMTEIFTQAVAVVAWLGHGTTTSDKSMRIIADHYTQCDGIHTSQSSAAADKARAKKYHRGMAVAPLFQRRYWTRLWIAQEFILPRDLILICGEYVITWLELRAYHRSMLISSMSLEVFKEAEIFIIFRDGLHSTDGIVRAPKDANRLDIALIWFTHLGCQDPRDKVYGLLGLVKPDDRITIDYNKNAAEIFWEVLSATKLSLSICDTQFKLLGWSMGVTGHEPGASDCQGTAQYKGIFGSKSPCQVFSDEARAKMRRQVGSFVGSEKEIEASMAQLRSQAPRPRHEIESSSCDSTTDSERLQGELR